LILAVAMMSAAHSGRGHVLISDAWSVPNWAWPRISWSMAARRNRSSARDGPPSSHVFSPLVCW